MELSSTFRKIDSELLAVDVDTLSGEVAARVLQDVIPTKHILDAFVLQVAARALSANQHNADGATSGAAWIGEKTGVSEKEARAQLAVNRQLAELSDVAEAVRNGSLSLAKASVITRGADGDEAVASSLLEVASSGGTVELIELKAREIRSASSDESRHKRLRSSQFVNIGTDSDSMVTGSFRLLPEVGLPLLNAYKKSSGLTSWERAESFAELLSEMGSKKTEVVFHLDVEVDDSGELVLGEKASLKGVGPISRQTAIDSFEEASFRLVGTSKNKLSFFSEENRTSSEAPLPEFVKRAVRARSYDRCAESGCVNQGVEVDHVQARSHGGLNELENLQLLCGPHHVAKTTGEHPWTGAVIYGQGGKAGDKGKPGGTGKASDTDVRTKPEAEVEQKRRAGPGSRSKARAKPGKAEPPLHHEHEQTLFDTG